jgi:hypothetical protein
MALTLLRRRRIAPMRLESERPAPRLRDPITPVDDDYLIEGEDIDDQPPFAARVVNTLQIVLIIVAAILSLAIVWLLAVVFNIL